MKVEEKVIAITTPLGHSITAFKFYSKNTIKKTLVISSATGVLQHYYFKFACFFAIKGFVVFTFDYKGIGKSGSSTSDLNKTVTDLQDWGRNDQAAVVSSAKKEYPNSDLTLVTHSVGGQLLGFNPNYHLVDKVILVASQSGYWKFFKGFHQPKMWLLWHAIIPILTPVFGYFPARKLGLFENLPKNMVYQWAKWGKQKEYLMHFYTKETYFFEKIKVPILCYSFSNDAFAPRKTVDWMAHQYKNAKVKRIHYQSENGEREVKHFGFFKSDFQEPFWEQTLKWILNETAL